MRRIKLEAAEIYLRCNEKLNPTIARNIGSMYKYSHGTVYVYVGVYDVLLDTCKQ